MEELRDCRLNLNLNQLLPSKRRDRYKRLYRAIKPARVHVIGLGDITEDSKILGKEFWALSSYAQDA